MYSVDGAVVAASRDVPGSALGARWPWFVNAAASKRHPAEADAVTLIALDGRPHARGRQHTVCRLKVSRVSSECRICRSSSSKRGFQARLGPQWRTCSRIVLRRGNRKFATCVLAIGA